MKNVKNETHIEGYVYEHKLEKKVSGEKSKNPGTEFISGILSISTDESCTNIVQIHFSYVTAVTSKGNSNKTYNILEAIIDKKLGSVMADGIDNAAMVRIDSALDLNEWYDKDNQLISVKRNEGGFIHQVNELCQESGRATFDVDMVITGCKRLEANEEKDTPEKLIVKGAIFNFRKELLPVEFSVLHPGAMNYFESLEPSTKSPVFTRVKGIQISQISTRKVEETSAWGEVSIREVKSSSKDFVINWAQQEVYEWDDKSTILASELGEAIANREIHLAEIKKRQDDYQASKGSAIPVATAPAKSEYDF